MIDPKRIAARVAKSLLRSADRNPNPRPLMIEDAFRRGFRLGLSIRTPPNVGRERLFPPRRSRAMAHELHPRTLAARRVRAERLAVEVILHCERAACGRSARHADPSEWNRTAWRRYLLTAERGPNIAPLTRLHRDIA